MSISAEYSECHKALVIQAGEQFDSRCRPALQALVSQCEADMPYIFDFTGTTQVDSSGIGILIGLRQQLGGKRASISLINCGPEVMSAFMLTGLQELFTLSSRSSLAS